MSLNLQSKRKLNDGNEIPVLGFGVYQSNPGDETEQAVLWALEFTMIRLATATLIRLHVSTQYAIVASSEHRGSWLNVWQSANSVGYYNEESVGSALKKWLASNAQIACFTTLVKTNSDTYYKKIWVTTKLWDTDHGFDKAKEACEESLRKLGLDYIDLYLIHSPIPGKKLRTESWKALEELKKEGKVRSIGVSNYGVHHMKELLEIATIKPTINQIEVTPYQVREELCKFCTDNDVVVEAFSPLTMGLKLKEPRLNKIAEKYGKQPAQILIRWSLQRGIVPLPKSVTKQRIIDNSNVFDFEISAEDMEALTKMDEYLVTEWDPTKLP
ncbi:hypothetical protein INT43_007492 [Umbelopsis isabellina]|uniref:NADP-dependent oxidoreductase domain-containing protein n=1 Tax=Mortierella isabellina TaxID=91625 RepID=A0A8H7PYQ2_MORIS|nr:hypothetical protein INT43_007492 [Umbelopsis isabellina]